VTSGLQDRLGRPFGSVRISVTDRCNLRCRYCMPEDEYLWLPRDSLLTFEEIARLTTVFTGLGAHKVRLTGGEPLLRHQLQALVVQLRRNPAVLDLALTTNGVLLARAAAELASAGLHRVTVSLDTLRPDRMARFARSERHADVLRGIDAATAAGLAPIKLNTVLVRGFNDDEIEELIRFGQGRGLEVRFIEYMDVGGATRWNPSAVISRDEILGRLSRTFGEIVPLPDAESPAAPAERYRLSDGTRFGVIASMSAPFCRTCDRGRLTADGTWFNCLYADRGLNLRDPLRFGASDAELAELVADTWRRRDDRGAEQRLAAPGRGVLYPLETLRADPRREMHTRGG